MSTTAARQEIAGNVRAILGKHKISQTKLAAYLGMSQAALSRRLSGELAFDTDEILSIAAAFDVPISKFFDGVTPPDQGIRSTIWDAATHLADATQMTLAFDLTVAA